NNFFDDVGVAAELEPLNSAICRRGDRRIRKVLEHRSRGQHDAGILERRRRAAEQNLVARSRVRDRGIAIDVGDCESYVEYVGTRTARERIQASGNMQRIRAGATNEGVAIAYSRQIVSP